MAFNSLSSLLIEVGKPIVKSIFTTLKSNQDDINARVLTVEAATNKIVFFDGIIYATASIASGTGLIFHKVESNITLTDCKISLFDFTGVSSGTIEVDVQKSSSTDFASSVSVFTTKPSMDLSVVPNYSESSNTVFSGTNKILTQGDFIRIDISSLPTGLGKFNLFLIGEPT